MMKCVFLVLVILQSGVNISRSPAVLVMESNAFCSLFLANNVLPQARPTKTILEFSSNEMYDAENHPNPKLNKIWPIFKNLENKCMALYTPERDVTINKSPLLYKGSLGWVQYIPQKIARFGIKTHAE
jgi:hypothetical protein